MAEQHLGNTAVVLPPRSSGTSLGFLGVSMNALMKILQSKAACLCFFRECYFLQHISATPHFRSAKPLVIFVSRCNSICISTGTSLCLSKRVCFSTARTYKTVWACHKLPSETCISLYTPLSLLCYPSALSCFKKYVHTNHCHSTLLEPDRGHLTL